MTLSSFRALPRKGHLDRAKCICGYIAKMKHAVLRFRTGLPDFSDLPDPQHDWEQSVYGNVQEIIPPDAPEALGRPIILTHYFDANLYHDMVTEQSANGILHFANQCPIDWFSKKQATVETATFGSEFVSGRTCVEQCIDICLTFRYLGVRILTKSRVFGDNKSMIDSASKANAKLHKRHTALSFHRVCEAVAAKVIGLYHIAGKDNPADLLSKHWAYSDTWPTLQALLFWQGDTALIKSKDMA